MTAQTTITRYHLPVTDYCACNRKANRLCNDCRTPMCTGHQRASAYEVARGPFKFRLSASQVTIARCDNCADVRISKAIADPDLTAYASKASKFESACAIAAWATCLELLNSHDRNPKCCPEHWRRAGGGKRFKSFDDFIFYGGEQVAGPFFDGMDHSTFIRELIAVIGRRKLTPSRELRLSRFKYVRAFAFGRQQSGGGGLHLGADAEIYHQAFKKKYFQILPKTDRFYADTPERRRWLLASAHYIINEAYYPEENVQY